MHLDFKAINAIQIQIQFDKVLSAVLNTVFANLDLDLRPPLVLDLET